MTVAGEAYIGTAEAEAVAAALKVTVEEVGIAAIVVPNAMPAPEIACPTFNPAVLETTVKPVLVLVVVAVKETEF